MAFKGLCDVRREGRGRREEGEREGGGRREDERREDGRDKGKERRKDHLAVLTPRKQMSADQPSHLHTGAVFYSPQLDGAVGRGGGHTLVYGGEDHTPHPSPVAPHGAEVRAISHAPQLGRRGRGKVGEEGGCGPHCSTIMSNHHLVHCLNHTTIICEWPQVKVQGSANDETHPMLQVPTLAVLS